MPKLNLYNFAALTWTHIFSLHNIWQTHGNTIRSICYVGLLKWLSAHKSVFSRSYKVINIHFSLRASHKRFVGRLLHHKALPRLNLCLTPFSGETPLLIIDYCTSLIRIWKRRFRFEAWQPSMCMVPLFLVPMKMLQGCPESMLKLHVLVCTSVQLISCCAVTEVICR